MKYEQIVLFQRPGTPTMIGNEVLLDVREFAEERHIPIIYYKNGMDIPTDDLHSMLFIAIGGDGTLLRAMDVSLKLNITSQRYVSSVIGFHAGTLGFLTEDSKNPKRMLTQIWEGSKEIQCHELLALSMTLDGKEHFAINEFTFTPSEVSSPLKYDVRINDSQVASHVGSGCMVATPTGSTAMSMSAGGAIINPTSNVMQFVPIIPHTLSSRPVITSSDDTITISSIMERVTDVIVSSDGRQVHRFGSYAKITVQKAAMPVMVWYVKDRDFFNILSTKLNW